MKNMYRVTRPTWAGLDRQETAFITSAVILLAFYGATSELIAKFVTNKTIDQFQFLHVWGPWIGKGVDGALTAGLCLLMLRWYRKVKIGCYPSTYLYCFDMPNASNPDGRSHVVGFCYVDPDSETGDIKISGASFFWRDSELDLASRVGFTSTNVWATKMEQCNTCHIRYNIDPRDENKRLYRHGLLQFQWLEPGGAGRPGEAGTYCGYLRSTNRDLEAGTVTVQAKGYAEWYSKGVMSEESVHAALTDSGPELFKRLRNLKDRDPAPRLWEEQWSEEAIMKTNYWGLQIPTPQSAILRSSLQSQVDAYLSKVLGIMGLSADHIEQCRSLLIEARTEDSLGDCEKKLKQFLAGKVRAHRETDALEQRASIITDQIRQYVIGDSILDVGCGNGRIARNLKDGKSRVQLVDVVKYVPDSFKLPFAEWREGQDFPISDTFDTVLLLTVLHHSSEPLELLKLAWKAARRRLIIIESVVGVHKPEPSAPYELLSFIDEDQIAFAAFVDWFYNRVLHDDVPVPYNFTSPQRWQSVFIDNEMPLRKVIHLGQDIEIGPEYHVLFVLDKEELSSRNAA